MTGTTGSHFVPTDFGSLSMYVCTVCADAVYMYCILKYMYLLYVLYVQMLYTCFVNVSTCIYCMCILKYVCAVYVCIVYNCVHTYVQYVPVYIQ